MGILHMGLDIYPARHWGGLCTLEPRLHSERIAQTASSQRNQHLLDGWMGRRNFVAAVVRTAHRCGHVAVPGMLACCTWRVWHGAASNLRVAG